ncbi:MAG: ABC transporter permease [Burkholderiales bacterium]|nr:ABC transporter permease [Burkholderiales bacterium]
MSTVQTVTLAPPRRTLAERYPALRRFLRHRAALLGVGVVLFMTLLSFVGPLLMPFNATDTDIRARLTEPFVGAHLLGTDPLGRDVLARLMYAGRISLAVGFAATALSVVVGVLVGLVALIEPSVTSIVVIIALASWMEVARVVEGQIRSLRERDFALAAESLGASDSRIMFRELLPNAVAPIVVAATLNIAHAILAESYISFLGFGIQPPTPSWGNMLENAQSYLTNAPWLAIVPGLAITLTVTSFNFIGDGLRDALDAKLDR